MGRIQTRTCFRVDRASSYDHLSAATAHSAASATTSTTPQLLRAVIGSVGGSSIRSGSGERVLAFATSFHAGADFAVEFGLFWSFDGRLASSSSHGQRRKRRPANRFLLALLFPQQK